MSGQEASPEVKENEHVRGSPVHSRNAEEEGSIPMEPIEVKVIARNDIELRDVGGPSGRG